MITQKLHNYMVYRAATEGHRYDLTPEYLQDCYDEGAVEFFGVRISDAGDLLSDNQNPETFHTYHTYH